MKAVLPSFFFPHTKTLPFSPSTSHNSPHTIPKRISISLKSSKPTTTPATQDDGIPIDLVKTLVKFKSRHNYIRVLEVSRTADHPFRGSRLLLLDSPGNIHSISFLFKTLTNTYFDVFATLPPIIPPGPIGILGFGAGSAAKILLNLYSDSSSIVVHGWEIDPAVIDVGREYFGLAKVEKKFPERLFVYIGNALNASLGTGFSGILVDLFSKGSLIPELQNPATWYAMKMKLRDGGRIMVNVGGSCVESEDSRIDGKVIMQKTLMAMKEVFGEDGLNVLSLGNRDDDSSIALTGPLPTDLDIWKKNLPNALHCYVHMWNPVAGVHE